MVWLTIWLGSGVIAALAASSRGRFAAGWFLLGLLFGPLAVFAVLVMGPLPSAAGEIRQRIAGEPRRPTRMRPCPHCFGEIDARATACRHCARDVTPLLPVASARPAGGNSRGTQPSEEFPSQGSPGFDAAGIFVLVISIFLVIIGGALWHFWSNGGTSATGTPEMTQAVSGNWSPGAGQGIPESTSVKDIRWDRIGYTRSGMPNAGTFFVVIHAKGVPPDRAKADCLRIGRALCSGKRVCFVHFWEDAQKAANHLPMTDVQLAAEVATYNKSAANDRLVCDDYGSPGERCQ